MAPLSLEEFCGYKNSDSSDTVFEYMGYGGILLAVLKMGEEEKGYLRNLSERTDFKDLLERNNLKKSEALDSFCNVIIGVADIFLRFIK